MELLLDNGMDVPVVPYSGAREETDLFLRAVKLVGDLQAEMAKLHAKESKLEGRHYNMLRDVFLLASTDSSYERYLYRTVINVITDEMLRPERDRSHAFYRFLEIFQHTFRHRASIDVDKGELVLQARLKKTILGNQENLGDVYAEVKVLNGRGDIEDTRFLSSIQSTEVVVVHFERLANLSLAALARNTRLLLNTQSLAREIYERLQWQFQIEGDDSLAMEGSNVLTAHQIAVSHIVYQYALFHLLNLYRPAIFVQRDYYVAGSDPMGWLVALQGRGGERRKNR